VKRVWLICVGAALPLGMALEGAHAQTVYKCSSRSYSEQPCSTRIVRTYDAPVPTPPKAADVVAQRLPGESSDELAMRKHRAHLSQSDRDECARLDKRIPFERERLKKTPGEPDVDEAQSSLSEGVKRFRQLRC
jgi:hypothetical protein